MKRRNLILLLGGASSGAMTVGTGAFSSAQVDRGVSVSVVNDDEALVGYDSPSDVEDGKQVTDGSRIDLVTVENRFARDTTISVEEVTVDVDPDDGEYPQITDVKHETDEFGSGETEAISGVVQCGGDSERATVEVTVRVVGEGVSAELFGDTETRRFEIVCREVTTYTAASGAGIDGVDFKGNGKAEVLSPGDGDVGVRIYYVDGDEVAVTDSDDVPVNANLRGRASLGGKTIVGVHVVGIDGVFVHPQFDADDCDVMPGVGNSSSSGSGNSSGVSGGKVTKTDDPDDAFGDCLDD